jgi:hypothetical protein
MSYRFSLPFLEVEKENGVPKRFRFRVVCELLDENGDPVRNTKYEHIEDVSVLSAVNKTAAVKWIKEHMTEETNRLEVIYAKADDKRRDFLVMASENYPDLDVNVPDPVEIPALKTCASEMRAKVDQADEQVSAPTKTKEEIDVDESW